MKRFDRSLRLSNAARRALSPRRSPEARLGSLLAAILALVAALGLTSCGAAPASTAITCSTTTSSASSTTSTSTCTDPVTNISITISPATVSVNVVTEQQFQVSIQGGTNSIPIWEVNGVQGGSDAAGRIDSNGLYHAPVVQPMQSTGDTVTVSVGTSQDPKLSASSTVTITPAPVVTVTWNVNSTTCTNSSTSTSPTPSCPTSITSGTGNTATFTAGETGGATNTIVWSVGPTGGLPIEGGNATLGAIDTNGVFSAPATPPIGQVVTVTASAQDSPTSSASLNVTISGYSTSSLQGQFAFSLSGSNASGHLFRAGSFTADSTGNLTSVVEDVNPASGGTGNPITTTGTYTIGSDGRGQLSFNDGLTPAKFDFVLLNSGQLQIIGFDSSGTASGQANAQDASTFSGAPLSALNGTYVFDFAGVHGANALSQIGEFTADGAGSITQGLIDTNDGGTTSAAPFQIYGSKTPCTPSSPPALSSYTVSSNGRGTLTLNTVDSTCATTGPSYVLTFYVVSRGIAKFVGTDSVLQVGGYTSRQTPGATFNLSALGGSFAFLLAGSGPGGPLATAGNFAPDGSGNLTSGVLDENVNGTPAPDLAFQASGTNVGTYTLGSNGRGTLTFATAGRTYKLVFYLGLVGTNTTAVLQETDSGIASDGNFTLQQSATFALSSIQGNYAIQTSGTSGGLLQAVTGQVGADGAGAIKAGSLVDVNTGGTVNPGQAVTGAYAAPAASGRTVLTLSPINPIGYAAYVVNPNEVYLLGIQPGQLAAGVLLRQF